MKDDRMHARTTATLEQLSQEQWFRAVGKHDTDAAIVLTSWNEAVESCGSSEWQDLCLEAANQYRGRLLERSPEAMKNWNDVVRAVKPVSEALAIEKTNDIVLAQSLPKVFLDMVKWDLLHLCMECEFSDIYQPGFYASQAYWYANGHFPCGWRGSFPQGGKLIIY